MKSCGMNCIRFLLYFFNFIFVISGIGIITAGSLALTNTYNFEYFDKESSHSPPIVLIVTGCIVFVVAFLGCCGACRESTGMLIAYGVLLLLILILELAAGIVAATQTSDVIEKDLQESRAKYYSDDAAKIGWDTLQKGLMCCGVNGPAEWGASIPISCCIATPNKPENDNPYCSRQDEEKKYLSSVGCLEKLKENLKKYSVMIKGVGIGIGLIELFGIILAFWLAAAIKRERGKVDE